MDESPVANSLSLRRLILGRALPNREREERKIGVFAAIPAMGLDALASTAYGPEAALAILAPLGAAAPARIVGVMAPIVALLCILYVSYRQTIAAYPVNGGAYTVALANLGERGGLLAATALMVDYVLNAAVGTAAGIGALVSAAPALHPYALVLCLGTLALVTLLNLRGTVDAGRVFALPTYVFIASFAVLLVIGIHKAVLAGGAPQPVTPLPPLATAAGPISLWLLVRAFAAGCTAMTGVEAVSNGMGDFRAPAVRHGRRALSALVGVLGLMLCGIAYLVQAYGIGATDQTRAGYQSVLSQLAGAVAGRGPFYVVAIGSLLCVLILSANTSFVGFPRLCQQLAQDRYLPRPFALVGRRLVFSVGILVLAGLAGLLLVTFDGITDRLIPLFAIGAFLTFTLSQAGMVAHWLRVRRDAAGRARLRMTLHLAVNLLGAVTTGAATLVILAAKFRDGAWITVLAVPLILALLVSIRRYYDGLADDLRDENPLDLRHTEPPIVLVVTEEWSRLTDKALNAALRLSPDVVAVHLLALEGGEINEKERALRREWARDVTAPARAAGLVPPRLVLLRASYRNFHLPILKFTRRLAVQLPHRTFAVVVPELVKSRWWQHLLHSRRAQRLRGKLLRDGASDLIVVTLPWYVGRDERENAVVRRRGNQCDSRISQRPPNRPASPNASDPAI
jgi:amino acid transporter